MALAHDTEVSLMAAVALVNSAEEPDTLVTVADLDRMFEEYEYTGRHDRSETELEEVRSLRARLREVLVATRDDAVPLVNEMLAEARALPQLRRHDRFDWHLHAVDPGAPLARRTLVETAMAMVDLIRADEMSRLSVCADDDCGSLVLDLSRNRSRRYCSTTCGNRNAVAAYRARRSAPPS